MTMRYDLKMREVMRAWDDLELWSHRDPSSRRAEQLIVLEGLFDLAYQLGRNLGAATISRQAGGGSEGSGSGSTLLSPPERSPGPVADES